MSEQQTGAPAPDAPTADAPKEPATFTQAEVDRIVRERVQRERAKFADYDDLKAKADASKTLDERLAEVEKRAASAEARALRSDIAAEYGVSAEDRDLFLTGADRETLEAQAKRLAARESDRKKQGNVAPKEGASHGSGADNSDMREFTRNLFKTGAT